MAAEKVTGRKVEILVVEDSPTQAEKLKYMLEGYGFITSVVENGGKAMEHVQRRRPTIIISDIVMPEMDGYELCRRMKGDEALKDVPVILLTALSDPEDVLRGLECGADNFITKPYEEKYLVARIHSIIANMKLRENKATRMGIEISFGGEIHYITSDRQQILDLLLSTYETAVQKNRELLAAQDELRALNEKLEEKVKERTAELTREVEERRLAEEKVIRLNRLYSVLSHSNQTIIRMTDQDKLLREICRVAVEHGRFSMAWTGMVDPETNTIRPVADCGADRDFLDNIAVPVSGLPEGLGPSGTAASEGRHYICNDMRDDVFMTSWRKKAVKRGYRSYASFPVFVENVFSGLLNVYSPEAGFFDEKETQLLDELAADLSFALTSVKNDGQRKRAEEELTGLYRKVKEEAEVSNSLLQIVEALNSTLDEKSLIKTVAKITPRYLKFDRLSVFLYDDELSGFTFAGGYGLTPSEEGILLSRTFRHGDFPAIDEIMKGKMVVLKDAGDGGLIAGDLMDTFRLGSMAVAPISFRGRVGGGIVGAYRTVKPFEEKDLPLLKGLADGIGIALQNSRLYKQSIEGLMELSVKIETIKAMSQIDREILSNIDRTAIMRTATALLNKVMPCDRAAVVLKEGDSFRVVSEWGIGEFKDERYGIEQDCCEVLGRMNNPVYLSVISNDTCRYHMEQTAAGIKSSLVLPLTAKDGAMGFLDIGSAHHGRLSSEHLSTAQNIASQITVALENSRLYEELQELLINAITSLASAIDAKSPWTKGHSERVTMYAVEIGVRMGLGEAELESLRLAGLLHDIGKIGTYDVILDKPSRLTDEEFALVKKHPERGCEILSPIKQFKNILPAIRHHHERCDGTGYPDGLKGGDIPLHARILCVADSFDSMTADRPYRPAPGIEYAVAEFERCKGCQFDAEVVEAFIGIIVGMKKAA